MDLAEGDLFSAITDQHLYLGRDALIRQVFCQIIDALEYCHSKGIYHRDLKPESELAVIKLEVYLTSSTDILCANSGGNVMLSDFGLATAEPVSRDFGCGSSYYMSPGIRFRLIVAMLVLISFLSECYGGVFQRVSAYAARPNDVWALGT